MLVNNVGVNNVKQFYHQMNQYIIRTANSTFEMEQEETQIINIAVNIFQNVGIKRWIDQISALRNQHIYFQICKIIFPETMIKLFRLSQDSTLTSGEKIQGVIDIIAKLLKNDLYHISGEAIAQGKLNHLRNFLQLLEALSDNVFVNNDEIHIRTAPAEKDNSQGGDIDHAYYTVMGLDREFSKPIGYDSEDEEQKQSAHKKQNRKPSKHPLESSHKDSSEEDSDDFRIKPKGNSQKKSVKKSNVILGDSRKKNVKKVVFDLPSKRSRKETNLQKTNYTQKLKEYYPYPLPQRQKLSKHIIQKFNTKKTLYITKMHNVIEQLEKKNIIDQNENYQAWQSSQNMKLLRTQAKIDEESFKRTHLLNNKIAERETIVNALSKQDIAINNIKKLFKQQEKVYKTMRKREYEQEMNSLEDLMHDEYEEELQNAIFSNKIEVDDPYYFKIGRS